MRRGTESRRGRPCVAATLAPMALCVMTVVGAAGSRGDAASDAALPPRVRAVWDLEKASRESTPTRERVCVNGLWRWQPASAADAPAPDGGWGFFKVPGPWPGNNSYARKESQTAYPHPAWGQRDLTGVTKAWYQRQLTVPADWTGRRASQGWRRR